MSDLISRQAAIEAMGKAKWAKERLMELPSVQPDHIADSDKKVDRDCISRREALKICRRYWHPTFNPIMEEIEKLPSAQPEPHWIPCSERLPGKNCRCLTTNEAWGSFEVDWNAWIDGRWLYPNEKPIAWMPLPKAYLGGEE